VDEKREHPKKQQLIENECAVYHRVADMLEIGLEIQSVGAESLLTYAYEVTLDRLLYAGSADDLRLFNQLEAAFSLTRRLLFVLVKRWPNVPDLLRKGWAPERSPRSPKPTVPTYGRAYSS